MTTGVTTRKIEIWRKRGNNWRKEGKPIPKGVRISGTVGGIYFYLDAERRTKRAWLKMDAITPPPPVEPEYIGWRCLHAREGGFVNPPNMPNVRRAKDAPPVKFTSELQKLAWEVMRAKNPAITQNNFRSIFESTTAFTNRHGIETDDPKLMDGIICSGMFLPFTAEIDGDWLTTYPGVHAIDVNQPLPSVQQVLDNGWWFVATTGAGPQGVYNFPQGHNGPVYIIYALDKPVRYPVSWFKPWRGGKPDPLKYYERK